MNKELQINYNSTILEALQRLNTLRDISRLILFVVDNNDKVIGSLTDGDIRRSLVKDVNINIKVGEICNREFLYEAETNGFIDLRKYRKKDIRVLPILNEDKTISRIIDLEKTQSTLPLVCILMAGGRGKRLSPLTDKIPKPMLLLGDKPIIEHNIDRLISYGIKKIYISLKYLGEQIESYFGDGSDKGISIEYIWEDKPLGTAGALSLVPDFESEQVLLMNSDLFTNVDFEDMYLKLLNENADMVVASTEYKIDVPYAVFESHGNKVTAFKEKPSFIYQSNAGVYLLKKTLVKKIPKNEFFDITDLMQQLVDEGGKLVFDPILGYWIDIGKPLDYQHAQEFIKHFNS